MSNDNELEQDIYDSVLIDEEESTVESTEGAEEQPSGDEPDGQDGAVVDDEPDAGTPQEGGAAPESEKSTATALSPEAAAAIGAEIAKGMRQSTGEQQPAQRQPMTPEERDRLLKRVHVTDEILQRMGFEDPSDEQIIAFQELLDGVATHGYTMAEARMQMFQRQLNEQISPLQGAYQEYQRQQAEGMFYGKYPALKQFPIAVREAAKLVEPTKADGKPKTSQEVMEEVAASAIEVVKQFNPEFDLSKATHSAPSTAVKEQQGAVPTMAGTMQGGRSQGGVSSGGSKNNPDADIYS